MAKEKPEEKKEVAEATTARETEAAAAPESAPELIIEEESFEAKQARLAREDYQRRNEQAIKEREEILRRNGLLGEGESLNMGPEAAGNQQCC